VALTRLSGRDLLGRGIDVVIADGIVDSITSTDVAPDSPYLTPGLVDLQVNGFGGFDVNGPRVTPEDVAGMVHRLAAVGTTTVVPTVITASRDMILRSLAAIRRACQIDRDVAAAVPYVHLEGPSLSSVEGPRGAHDAAQMRPPQLAELDTWQDAAGGLVGMVTLSPHYEETAEFIAGALVRGVRISIGHTHATPGQIRAAVDAGARFSTHLGNGIQAMLPRHPNAIWTQLADDRLTAGFIADGHHLPDDALLAMLRAKGSERSVVVSDSVALAGSVPGRYETPVGGAVQLFEDGRLVAADTPYLAGAGMPLLGCLSTLHRIGCSLDEAIRLTSIRPGQVAGRGGRIAEGERADILEIDWSDDGPDLRRAWWGGRPAR
jgi:N-acetylglucosamine-6-phosphate deacetylase